MLVIHEYPADNHASESVARVRQFASLHKPVLLGETFTLFCGCETQRAFLLAANPYLVGTLEFFDGRDPHHMTATTLADNLYQAGLQQFISLRSTLLKPQ